jgi:hypothetical protein
MKIWVDSFGMSLLPSPRAVSDRAETRRKARSHRLLFKG